MYPANHYSIQVDLMVTDVPCTFGLKYRLESGSPPGFPALDLVTTFVTTIVPALLDVLSSGVQLQRIIGRCLRPDDGVPYEANFDETNVGTAAAEPLPPSIAMLVKLKTISPNSRNNGHFYLPGLPEVKWVNGVWVAAFLSTEVAALLALLNVAMGSATPGVEYRPVVLSRYLEGEKLDDPVSFDVQTATVGTKISQQRRRQSGKQGIKT